jgi:sterol desaturase/sphingolipid hydroxylase (fatty acid hydroxylase superfamily)
MFPKRVSMLRDDSFAAQPPARLDHLLLRDCADENRGNPYSTAAAFVLLFVVYDFFYTIGHRVLHHRSIYKYIHKHHHRQRAPSRGNVDAVNVHPFEFVSGEYNHLLRYGTKRAEWLTSHFIVA